MAGKKGKITAKRVQAMEDAPPPAMPYTPNPEVDDDPWGDDGLTPKQRRFCEAYVGEAAGNATRAARLAGYREENRDALKATACENLTKPYIRGYIGRLLARHGASSEQLNLRLAELSRSSMENFLTFAADGEVEIDLKQAAALGALGQLKEIKEETIEIGENVVKRKRTIKVHDPHPAIRTLAEIQGRISAAGGVTVNVTQASEDDLVRIATRDHPATGGNRITPAASGAT